MHASSTETDGLPTACPEPTINETCHSENTLTTVQQTCIGRNMCVLTATNDFFSDDPCAGTFKALTVAWTCGSAIDNEFCVTAKENTGRVHLISSFNASS
jgi:hypothetical protein